MLEKDPDQSKKSSVSNFRKKIRKDNEELENANFEIPNSSSNCSVISYSESNFCSPQLEKEDEIIGLDIGQGLEGVGFPESIMRDLNQSMFQNDSQKQAN